LIGPGGSSGMDSAVATCSTCSFLEDFLFFFLSSRSFEPLLDLLPVDLKQGRKRGKFTLAQVKTLKGTFTAFNHVYAGENFEDR
jgi:hypothetical protein